jgi:hypothetical protein
MEKAIKTKFSFGKSAIEEDGLRRCQPLLLKKTAANALHYLVFQWQMTYKNKSGKS